MMQIFNITSLLLLAFLLTGCGDNSNKNSQGRIQSVYTFVPKNVSDNNVSFHSSQIEESKSVNVGFKTGGQIKKLTVKEGDYVTKGQIIGYLDDVDYKLQLNQLETQYAQVASEIKRIEEMHARNHVSDNDYEKAKAGKEQLRIQLDLVKNQLSYTRLVAPVPGHVVERYMEEGEMVGAGTPVIKIIDNSNLEAVVPLTSSAYSQKDKIIRCVGHSSATGDEEIQLDIIGFIPDADNNSLFKMRLGIPEQYKDKLVPGMNLNVRITYQNDSKSNFVSIPSRAIFEKGGSSYVWVINPADSTLTSTAVTIHGAPRGGFSEVSGLDESSVIVAAGVHHLADKEKVRILGTIDNLKYTIGK